MRPSKSPIPKTPLSSMHVIIVNAGIPSVRPETSKGAQSAMCCKAANEYTASFPSKVLSEGNLEPNTHRVLCDESSIPRVDNPTSSWSPDYQNHDNFPCTS